MEKQSFSKKAIHICIIFSIITVIAFIALMLILNYGEKGESNMPFILSKISIISSTAGKDIQNAENRWDIDVTLNNDIYVCIEKNDKNEKQELISNVTVENFNINKAPDIGELKFYKPTNTSEVSVFENLDENIVQKIIFNGATATNTKNLQISNQGGMICFRCSNNSVGKFLSNEEEEIDYNKLLEKMNLDENKLKATISFDLLITLSSGKVYKTESIEIQIPNENTVKEGTVGKEITDFSNIVFKRIENKKSE